jgi:hypothetical protein
MYNAARRYVVAMEMGCMLDVRMVGLAELVRGVGVEVGELMYGSWRLGLYIEIQ